MICEIIPITSYILLYIFIGAAFISSLFLFDNEKGSLGEELRQGVRTGDLSTGGIFISLSVIWPCVFFGVVGSIVGNKLLKKISEFLKFLEKRRKCKD